MDDIHDGARSPEPEEAPSPAHPPVLDSWPAHLAMAVVTGAVTARMPVQRWPRPARWALHGGMGAMTAAAAALAARRPDLLDAGDGATHARRSALGPAATAGVALGLGGLVAGLSRGSEAADGWMERTLAARGVRRPRVWMGAAAAGLSLAMSVVDRRRDAAGSSDESASGT